MSKLLDVEKNKNEVIVHSFDFLDTGIEENKNLAIEKLKDFAKFYNVPLKIKSIDVDFKIAFKEFILNIKGYNRTIINLYNALLKNS